MGTTYKIFIIGLLAVGLIFARGGKNNIRVVEKKVKSEHYWVKDYSKDDSNNQLERKRVHKRRRKIRKPIKGLR
tara:strand:+ start:254 stop:475 length:222 start_codon:yes stop_codon:yes gene_type:complete